MENYCILGHTKSVLDCALSADGSRALSASKDRTCILWDTDDGKLIKRFHHHTDFVNACALSADGKDALSASKDETCVFWNTQNGKTKKFSVHKNPVSGCALSANGKIAFSVSFIDKTIILWKTDCKKQYIPWKTINNLRNSVIDCALSANGNLLLIASNRTCGLWSTHKKEELKKLTHKGKVSCCALSADGNLVCSASSFDKSCVLWKPHKKEEHDDFFIEILEKTKKDGNKEVFNALNSLGEMTGMEAYEGLFAEYTSQWLHSDRKKFSPKKYFNIVIKGPPGTGKTRVAKIIADILLATKMIKGKFRQIGASDLIGSHLGETSQLCKRFLNENRNNVLFYDEINSFSTRGKEKGVSYGKEAASEIIRFLEENPPLTIVLIVAGYEKEIDENFFSTNKGLKSRFPIVVNLDNFGPEALITILQSQVKQLGLKLDPALVWTDKLDKLIIKNISLFQDQKHINGRGIEHLLEEAERKSERRRREENFMEKTLTEEDFEKALDSMTGSSSNVGSVVDGPMPTWEYSESKDTPEIKTRKAENKEQILVEKQLTVQSALGKAEIKEQIVVEIKEQIKEQIVVSFLCMLATSIIYRLLIISFPEITTAVGVAMKMKVKSAIKMMMERKILGILGKFGKCGLVLAIHVILVVGIIPSWIQVKLAKTLVRDGIWNWIWNTMQQIIAGLFGRNRIVPIGPLLIAIITIAVLTLVLFWLSE
mmetsp:Transcript_11235/g.27623  ORF Transcript_11235/g.27623 Transcript_11235/m.27623 type:complete len:713 (-) Transcript_11235:85-2223(-)